MTDPTPTALAARGPRSRRRRLGWALELVGMVVIYEAYDTLRDKVAGLTEAAFRHAKQIVSAERTLGLYWERDIQRAFLHIDWFIAFWNVFYGTVHFVIPVVALVWMYHKMPARYVRWRNTLVFMFGIAILTFWLYPLMPPRIMPAHYGFVDTAAHYFNVGPEVPVKFTLNGHPCSPPTPHCQPDDKAMDSFGNLYAAMPSFHIGWSTWSVLALWPLVRRRWGKALLAAYPLVILFCIVVTGNHWFLDAAGGWAVLGLGYCSARLLEQASGAWHRSRGSPRTLSRAGPSEPAGV